MSIKIFEDEYDQSEAMSYADFTEDEISKVIVSDEGIPDENDWLALFEMKDGRYGFLSAGCDYTGWD